MIQQFHSSSDLKKMKAVSRNDMCTAMFYGALFTLFTTTFPDTPIYQKVIGTVNSYLTYYKGRLTEMVFQIISFVLNTQHLKLCSTEFLLWLSSHEPN